MYDISLTEEILGSDHAIWWSKEGTHLCYAIFNDQNVVRYNYPFYGDPRNEYDNIRSILYPKVSALVIDDKETYQFIII